MPLTPAETAHLVTCVARHAGADLAVTLTPTEARALLGLVSPKALADLLRTPGAVLVLP